MTAKPNSKTLRFLAALVDGHWQEHVCLSIDEQGLITSISNDRMAKVDQSIDAVALPGMVNVHSHAFQRAFAGMSEYRTASHDSFWTWRSLMYDFVSRLTPEDVYKIAKQLYCEMLAAGYTWVGEFHYLHHDIDGRPYLNPAAMAQAVVNAASDAGIGLCLLPVLYQRGGFRNETLTSAQKRFAIETEEFFALFEACQTLVASKANCRIGVAIHSLRAVNSKVANRVLARLAPGSPAIPIHIHVAEQMQEVNDCVAVHQQRPVEYLFDNFSVDRNWCLIHATHLTEKEIKLIVDSQAVVGVCPTTEANLGDGVFRAKEFLVGGGRIAIGSDSHVSVDLRDELRTFEYGQRLYRQERAVLGTATKSVGRNLYEQCALGGASAIGLKTGVIKCGFRADFTLVDPLHPAIGGVQQDRLLDRLVFCNHGNPIVGTCVAGKVATNLEGRMSAR